MKGGRLGLPGDRYEETDGSVLEDGLGQNYGSIVHARGREELVFSLASALVKMPVDQKKQSRIAISNRERYVAKPGDIVIGKVERKFGDFYRIEIRAPAPAVLHNLSFSAATKQNNPRLVEGTHVIASVSACHKDAETTLSCAPAKERTSWVAGSYLGELSGGLISPIPSALAQILARDREGRLTRPLFEEFGPFQSAVGVNGLLWVSAEDPLKVVAISLRLRGQLAAAKAAWKVEPKEEEGGEPMQIDE